MTTVLHVVTTLGDLDGPARAAEESAVAQRARGTDARVWLSRVPGIRADHLVPRLRSRGVPVECRTDVSLLSPGAVADLTRTARNLGPGTVLHSHGERALLWSVLAAPFARARHVHTLHRFAAHDAFDTQRFAAARKLMARAEAVFVPHERLATEVPGARIVAPCLDPEAFTAGLPDREELRGRLGVGDHERMVLFLGRLADDRGADLLALVQAGLQQRSEAARLFVAGAGPYSPGVEAMTAVRHLGHRADAACLLHAADVLVMPYRDAGVPMVALEAAAVGVPAVGFAAGGIHGTGLVESVPIGDIDKLVERALALTRDPEARARRVTLARNALMGAFGPAAHAAALESAGA